jgi:ATP-dependent helicase/nuclease subunit B
MSPEMSDRLPRVFTIPSGVPFLKTLVQAIFEQKIFPRWPVPTDPFSTAEATIYVPTRRAAKVLGEIFVTFNGSGTLLLPRILPLGGLDEAEDRLVVERSVNIIEDSADLLPEIDPVQRRLVLTKFVLEWAKRIDFAIREGTDDHPFPQKLMHGIAGELEGFTVAKSLRDGLQFADALGHLIDTLVIYGKTWADVHALLPQDLSDEYWRISKDFLSIAAEAWPKFCSLKGVMDAGERRHLMIVNEADRLKREQPMAPIIAAGSTGSMPSTATLLSAISTLPQGSVILSGLDQALDDTSWHLMIDADGKISHPTHPQAQLARLIHEIGISRSDVVPLGASRPEMAMRAAYLTEVMRPHETTGLWHSRSERISDEAVAQSLAHVSVIEAEHESTEALAIAVSLRKALEIPGKTAALITPDRTIAERVTQELKRWGIFVDDSAGVPLRRTQAGSLAAMVVDAVAFQFSPTVTLALINHPHVTLGLDQDTLTRGRTAIDVGVLRKPINFEGLYGLSDALERAVLRQEDRRLARPQKRLGPQDWMAAKAILSRLIEIFDVVEGEREKPLNDIVALHATICRLVSALPDDPDAFDRLEGAEAVSELLDSIRLDSQAGVAGTIVEYLGFFEQLIVGISVLGQIKSHPRIKIWGLLEARLMSSDLVVLAGLDETVWPPETRADPFLNRPWRDELGLPAPERRIGQTAHDFLIAMGTDEVILTRAIKRGGAPTVASRFLQRMKAVAGEVLFAPVLERGNEILSMARGLDQAGKVTSIKQPLPVPSPHFLPRRLSVTEIETLRRDPYSIYAKHVLKLDVLDPVGTVVGASERGTLFHDVFARFSIEWPTDQPIGSLGHLLRIGRDVFKPIANLPEFKLFWWPGFEEAARWFVGWDKSRRERLGYPLAVERLGALTFELPGGGEFTLSGQADRIELLNDQNFTIVDYKTGKIPSVLQVKAGFSPQLTLEAAMLKRGAFAGLSGLRTDALLYVKLGGKSGGEEKPVRDSKNSFDFDELADKHFAELVSLLDQHWNEGRPFSSRPHPQFLKDFAHYDHLARVREWSLTGGNIEDGSVE